MSNHLEVGLARKSMEFHSLGGSVDDWAWWGWSHNLSGIRHLCRPCEAHSLEESNFGQRKGQKAAGFWFGFIRTFGGGGKRWTSAGLPSPQSGGGLHLSPSVPALQASGPTKIMPE
jgi:hypothetical protein